MFVVTGLALFLVSRRWPRIALLLVVCLAMHATVLSRSVPMDSIHPRWAAGYSWSHPGKNAVTLS